MRPWHSLEREERAILSDLRERGPDCAKFLSRRLHLSPRHTMDLLGLLANEGWLTRVEGTFLMKRGLRRPKHMNHTYYGLTRAAERCLRTSNPDAPGGVQA